MGRAYLETRFEVVGALANGCAAWLYDGSRVSGDVQARFCESLGVRLPGATHLICGFQYQDEAERFYRELPDRLSKFGLTVASEKTGLIRFSRFHPGMERRIVFLGFETYWVRDEKGEARVEQRTARKKLQSACRRIKEWIKDNRHLKGGIYIKTLNERLRGHYNYYNIPGNLNSLWRFYSWAITCSFKWLNRRGGKRKSFTWAAFIKAIDLLRIAKPEMKIVNRQHRVFA